MTYSEPADDARRPAHPERGATDHVAHPSSHRNADRRQGSSRPLPRRVYSFAGRRRKCLGRAGIAAVALLALAVAVIRISAVQPGTTHRAGRVPDTDKPLQLAWPREGQAAVAVEGLGTLGIHGGGRPVPIASVAKVMTAYLVLRDHPLDPGEEGFEIEISTADVEDLHQRVVLNQSVVAVEAGEVLSERQALEALLLPSANNVAALLAIHEAGSVEAFVAEMNEAAAELGMGKTHYTDPSGWEDTTVSTAADQLKIGRAAMADPVCAEIVAMASAVLPVAGVVANYNELVGHEGFVGIKTGSDEAAGGCLLFAREVEVGGRTLTVLGAVLGQREGELIQAALASAKASPPRSPSPCARKRSPRRHPDDGRPGAGHDRNVPFDVRSATRPEGRSDPCAGSSKHRVAAWVFPIFDGVNPREN